MIDIWNKNLNKKVVVELINHPIFTKLMKSTKLKLYIYGFYYRMEVVNNPWNVTSLEEFHFYNCPECEEKYVNREQFIAHAMVKHPKACEILPGILHEQNSVAMSNDQSVVKVERSDILVISNIQSIPLEESEGFDDGTSNLESTICIEKDEPMSDTKNDENCGSSKEEATSDADMDENCDVSNIFDTNTFEFEDTKNEKVEPMTDTKNDENCDTSNIELESTSDTESVESYDTSVPMTSDDDEDLSEYEKLRLKNIAERQAKFDELKIRDKVLDLSRNKTIFPGQVFDIRSLKITITKEEKKLADQKMDENCDVSNIDPVVIKISKKERRAADNQLKKKRMKNVKPASKDEKKKKYEKLVRDPLTKRFKCNQCQKDFSSKEYLIEHVESVHEGVKFQCDQCSKTYTYRSGLDVHIQSVHQGVTFKCDQCSKTYNSRSGLHVHIQSDHVGVTYNCHQCHKKFTQKTNLKTHI